ncbi:MAG: GNAT family N-acetyltransferase, partial [Acidobacteria bacterium]|nr:GNAT family N-acetyltransferase [Acidobacteriota bacterium]
ELEVGYCLAREAWGKGIAKEAVGALLELAFTALGKHRVFGFVDTENPASAGVLKALGFRLEGHLRKDSKIHGQWRDSLLFALLEEEWRERVRQSA